MREDWINAVKGGSGIEETARLKGFAVGNVHMVMYVWRLLLLRVLTRMGQVQGQRRPYVQT